MNRELDSLILLSRMIKNLPDIIPVKNQFFGMDFHVLDESQTGGKSKENTIMLPRLNPFVMNEFKLFQSSPGEFVNSPEQSIASKVEIEEWLLQCSAEFRKVA